MIAQLLVDGIDISDFGIYVSEGGLNGLLSFPSLKEPDKSDWAELNGIEVDLSAPNLDTKEFAMKFACSSTSNLSEFIALVKQGYHTFSFPNLSVTRSLRLVSVNDYNGTLIQSFSLTFADDFPLSGYTYQTPILNATSTGVTIDGSDIKRYGLVLLEGSRDEIIKNPPLKANLLVNSKYSTGAVYDAGVAKYQSKEVKLKLFFENWSYSVQNAFLCDLVRVGERTLTFEGRTFKFYYKSCSVDKISYGGAIWVNIELNLVFTKEI